MNQDLINYIRSNDTRSLINTGNGEKFTALNMIFDNMRRGVNFDENVERLRNNYNLLTPQFNIKINEYIHDKKTLELADEVNLKILDKEFASLLDGNIDTLTGSFKMHGIEKKKPSRRPKKNISKK